MPTIRLWTNSRSESPFLVENLLLSSGCKHLNQLLIAISLPISRIKWLAQVNKEHQDPVNNVDGIAKKDDILISNSTTHFINDGTVEYTTALQPLSVGQTYTTDLENFNMQNVIDFLKKPVPIASGTFTAGTTGILQTIDPYLPLRTQDLFLQKVKGNLGIRCKVVIRIVVNANRFQQGRYILAFLPFCGSSPDSDTRDAYIEMHARTLTQITQLMRAEIDINRDTEAILEIPWTSAYPFMPLKGSAEAKFGKPGQVYLHTYLPLQTGTGGSLDAKYTIYLHYEDVQIHCPTQPQMDRSYALGGPNGEIHEIPQFQMAKGKMAPQSAEQKAGDDGPVTTVLKNTSKVAGILSNVPVLSAFAGPASWALDIASKCTSVFGWSNPLQLSGPDRFVHNIFPLANNCDVRDMTRPLALYAGNTLEVLPGIDGTDVDQTSISFIATKSAYYDTFNLSTTDVVDSIVWQDDAKYSTYDTSFIQAGTQVISRVPLSYLSQFFQYARGGLIFSLKIASTEFHSGRYAVVFQPTEPNSGAVAPSVATASYSYREIVDLRHGCEFVFHVPYSSVLPYRVLDVTEKFGDIFVYCLNPLVAPAGAATSVSVAVEVAGAPDIEFAAPRGNSFELTSATFQMDNSYKDKLVLLGNSPMGDPEDLKPARMCIGEKILSVLSLCKRSDIIEPFSAGTANAGFTMDPWFMPYRSVDVATVNSFYKCDTFAMIAGMYGMVRGSVRIRVRSNNRSGGADSLQYATARLVYSTTNPIAGLEEFNLAGGGDDLSSGKQSNRILANVDADGGIEVQVPFHHHTFAHPVQEHLNVLSSKAYNFAQSVQFLRVNMCKDAGILVERAAGDDLQFASFISCPLISTP
jgi:hypothetical protein